MAVGQAALEMLVEVANDVLGVQGNEVPGAFDPLAADLDTAEVRGDLIEPLLDAAAGL